MVQIVFFAELYKYGAKTFAYIVLAMPLIYICVCGLFTYRNCFAQGQQTKIRFLMISGLFLVFEIPILIYNYQAYFIFKLQIWVISYGFAVTTGMTLYMAAIFVKMAFTLPSLQLTDMYNLEKISSLDKTCGTSSVLVFLAVFLLTAFLIQAFVAYLYMLYNNE